MAALKVTGGDGLKWEKESENRNSRSDWYNSDEGYSLDRLNKDVNRFFEDEDIKAVQVIMKIKDPETGYETMVSKVLSPDQYYEMEYDSVEEYIEDSIFGQEQYKGYGVVAGGISVRTYK